MNRTLKKLLLFAGSTIPALAMFAGTAFADVSPNNKVKNGDFNNATDHWAYSSLPKAAIANAWGTLYVRNIQNASYTSLATAYQCIPVTGGLTYELSGKMYIPSGQKRSGQANLEIQFHSSPNCSGFQAFHVTTPVTAQNAWKLQKKSVVAPKLAKSALVRLRVQKNETWLLQKSSDQFAVFFDDIQVVSKLILGPAIDIDDVIVDTNPDNDPTPSPTPSPTPAPQDDPDPTPAPQDDPDPTPAPQDEPQQPEDDGETVEDDVPGQDVPTVPDLPQDDGEDSSSEDVSEDAGESGGPGDGSDSGSGDDESDGASSYDDGESVANHVQTLGGVEEKSEQKNKQSGKGGSPTPAAPEAGNASSDEDPLFGMTEMAVIGAVVLTGMGFAFVAGSRRSRKEDPRELPFE